MLFTVRVNGVHKQLEKKCHITYHVCSDDPLEAIDVVKEEQDLTAFKDLEYSVVAEPTKSAFGIACYVD